MIALRISATTKRIFSDLPAGAFHGSNFGTHTFPAQPWGFLTCDTLHEVRLYLLIFIDYTTVIPTCQRVSIKKEGNCAILLKNRAVFDYFAVNVVLLKSSPSTCFEIMPAVGCSHLLLRKLGSVSFSPVISKVQSLKRMFLSGLSSRPQR